MPQKMSVHVFSSDLVTPMVDPIATTRFDSQFSVETLSGGKHYMLAWNLSDKQGRFAQICINERRIPNPVNNKIKPTAEHTLSVELYDKLGNQIPKYTSIDPIYPTGQAMASGGLPTRAFSPSPDITKFGSDTVALYLFPFEPPGQPVQAQVVTFFWYGITANGLDFQIIGGNNNRSLPADFEVVDMSFEIVAGDVLTVGPTIKQFMNIGQSPHVLNPIKLGIAKYNETTPVTPASPTLVRLTPDSSNACQDLDPDPGNSTPFCQALRMDVETSPVVVPPPPGPTPSTPAQPIA